MTMTRMIMNSSKYPSWLNSFFSNENRINFEKPNVNPLLNSISPLFLKAIDSLNSENPFFLASYLSNRLFFYGFAHSKQQLLELKNSLNFALSTSHTSTHKVIKLSNLDFETEVLRTFNHGIVKFEFYFSRESEINQTNLNYVVTTLSQIHKRFEMRPILNIVSKRPIGRILRDFFIALEHKDHDLIDEYKEELKNEKGLSHRNFVSIELQAYAAKEEWNKVFHHPFFRDYINGIIPSKISLVIIEGLSKIFNLDSNNLSDVDLGYVLTSLDPYAPLLMKKTSIPNNKSFESQWKYWTIFNLLLGAKYVKHRLPDFIDDKWFDLTYKKIQASHVEMEVREAFSSELKKLIKNEKTLDAATRLLEYSSNASSIEIPEIVDWLNELPAKIVKQVKSVSPLRQRWNQLEDFIYDSEQIENDTDNSAIESKLSAQVTWNDWFSNKIEISTDVLLDSDTSGFDITLVTKCIRESSESAKIRDVTPILLKWIANNNKQTNAAFWIALIELISIDEQTSIGTVLLLKDLTFNLMEVPHSSADYTEALSGFDLVIENELSVRSLPDIVEFVERLHDYPIKDENKLKYEVWPKVRAFAERNWVDLDVSYTSVLLWLEMKLTSETPILSSLHKEELEKESANRPSLKGIKVGISTLTEKAGIRAAEILKSQFEGIEVFLNNDKVATDKLTNLAKSADYFIFCNKSAAHQAYYAIKGISKDIIYVDGKGSSSIVRAFFKALL